MPADDTIFPAEDALTLSTMLLYASERMPGISDADFAALLEAAHVLAAHGCNAVIAGVVTGQSLARLAPPAGDQPRGY